MGTANIFNVGGNSALCDGYCPGLHPPEIKNASGTHDSISKHYRTKIIHLHPFPLLDNGRCPI